MNPLATAEFFIAIKQADKAKIALDLVKPYCVTVAQLDAIGKLYAEIREFNDSLEIAHRLYASADSNQMRWDLRVNMIRALLSLNRPVEALTYVNINETIDSADHANRMDKAQALFLLNRKPEGEAILRKILTEPRSEDVDTRVKFNLGTYDLENGNFKSGLKSVLLDGRKLNIWETYNLPKQNYWQGGVQPGKTILICAEGGIGDEIISVRFMRHFEQHGMKPIWYTTRNDLAAIFDRHGFKTISDLSLFDPDWVWTYSMLAPVFLQVDEDDLWKCNYLTPINKSPKLEGTKKIGIKCMGNPKYDQDLHRNVPLDQLVDAIPDEYTIYSFHVDEHINHPRVICLKDQINSWDDTLDYLSQMDIMISSCTSTAHAAGALGVNTAVLVPILNYYTWAKRGAQSNWYGDNLVIIRQTQYDNWNDPINCIKRVLCE